MTTARTSDLWWKNAVIYCLDPETFLDWNDDGIGDLTGLTERVDYLAGMGITCIWLMPFYPSPNRDDGYDIIDYYGVDPALGTLGDFVALVRTAKDRGIRVIVDLVVNHTSDRHPWFRAARSSPDSPFRDFYVWRDEPPADATAEPVFPDAEDSVWSFDEKAGQWYLHHFYAHQPDLNLKTADVREEISKIAGFWLQVGVDGFRVDAVPFLLEEGKIGGDVDLDPHEFLRDFRSFVSRRRGDSLLLGEVNLPPDSLPRYFGRDGDEIQLLFNFPVMQRMYLSLVRGDARPLAEALRGTEPVEGAGFANFVRNHDELTLDQLAPEERHEVFAAFGPEEDMQLFGRGLRRRLPPMLDGDQQRIRMVYSLLFSLPGTPVLFYGEEIGMGENLDVPGRMSVRTPMQWSDDENGGFSHAPASKLRRPVVEGRYSPLAVNVAAQRRDPDSLLSWIERLIRRRRETPEIGWGTWTVLEADSPSVFAHRCDWEQRTVVAVHKLSADTEVVRIDIGDVPDGARVDDLLDGEVNVVTLHGSVLELKLEGYGFRWFRVTPAERASAP
ncbi:MAG TPA: alpha-amylase family protein [Actinomycetota bacterium]|nr:alpha-amylase family protein [Actinomycetota bacterium]